MIKYITMRVQNTGNMKGMSAGDCDKVKAGNIENK